MDRNITGKQRKISILEGDGDVDDNTCGFNQDLQSEPNAKCANSRVATFMNSFAKYSHGMRNGLQEETDSRPHAIVVGVRPMVTCVGSLRF